MTSKHCEGDQVKEKNSLELENDKLTLRQKILKQLNIFCESTSAHGLGHMAQSNSLVFKLFWCVLFWLALAGIIWQLSHIVLGYYAYHTSEVFATRQESIPFPDVTVCNIEPLADRAFEETLVKESLLHEYATRKLPKIWELIAMNPNITVLDAGRAGSTKGYFENSVIEETKHFSHYLRELILQCRFSGWDCTEHLEDYFRYLPDGTYYNCYTFSAEKIGPFANGLGPDMGLSLIFYLGTTASAPFPGRFDSSSNVKQGTGVRVTIHNPGTLTSPITQGFDIPPGYSTSVGLQASKIERLGQPYGNCTESRTHSYLPQFKYSASACLLLHAQMSIFQQCGCVCVDLPVPGRLQEIAYCGFYNYSDSEYIEKITCEQEAYRSFYARCQVGEDLAMDCVPSCLDYSYQKEASHAKWPNIRYHKSFYQEIIANHSDRDSIKAYKDLKKYQDEGQFNDSSIILDNFARLNVFFTSSELSVRSQVPSYESSNLLSDMGGTIGLWAGLSLVTVIEVVILTVKIILLPFRIGLKDA